MFTRNKSYLRPLQLRRSLAYVTLVRLSPINKYFDIIGRLSFRLSLYLNDSIVGQFLVSLSNRFHKLTADGIKEDWYNVRRDLGMA